MNAHSPQTQIDAAPGIVREVRLLISDAAQIVPIVVGTPAAAALIGKHITGLASLIQRIESYGALNGADPIDETLPNFRLARHVARNRAERQAPKRAPALSNPAEPAPAAPAPELPTAVVGGEAPVGRFLRDCPLPEPERALSGEPSAAAIYLIDINETVSRQWFEDLDATHLAVRKALSAFRATCTIDEFARRGPDLLGVAKVSDLAGEEAVRGAICRLRDATFPLEQEEAPQLPSEAKAEPSAQPANPAPLDLPKPETKGNQALNLYAGTTLSHREIAMQIGMPTSSVSAFVSTARAKGDPRVAAGEKQRGRHVEPAEIETALAQPGSTTLVKAADRQPALVEVPVIGTVHSDPPKRRVVEIKDDRRPTEPEEVTRPIGAALAKPLPTSAPGAIAKAAITRPVGDVQLVPAGAMAFDETANAVAGPKGVWQVSRPVLLTLKRLAALKPGEVLSTENLFHAWGTRQQFLDRFPQIVMPLREACGIDLVIWGKNTFRLQVAA